MPSTRPGKTLQSFLKNIRYSFFTVVVFVFTTLCLLNVRGYSSGQLSDWQNESRKLWSTDLHAAPVGCQIDLLNSINVEVVAKIDFSNCGFFQNSDGKDICANTRGLKVFKQDGWNGFSLDPSPALLRRNFYDAYKNDEEFGQVDYVVCSHPAANCELYLAFNKSIIVYSSTRVEFGRNDEYVWWRQPYLGNRTARWNHWKSNLKQLSRNPLHLVAANNRYDVNHMLYHTGIRAKYIPSWCGGALSAIVNGTYNPHRSELVLTPYRLNLEYAPESIPERGWPLDRGKMIDPNEHPIFHQLRDIQSPDFRVMSMSDAFPGGFETFSAFGAFKAAVVIPYQASTMFFFELYRSATPILAPSSELLLDWVRQYRILWEVSYGNPPKSTERQKFGRHPNPNSFDVESRKYWVKYFDIYQKDVFPHIIYFNSWSHAKKLARNTDFRKVSEKMQRHNILEFHRIRGWWMSQLNMLDEARGANPTSISSSDHDTELVQKGFDSLSEVEDQLLGDAPMVAD